jgi:hypothetical protein
MNATHTGDHRYGDAAIWMPLERCFKGMLTDAKNFDPSTVRENVPYNENK